MASRAKYTEVMSVIKRRIAEGDYLLSSIPGERRIAEETGVSYMTARKAVQGLLDEQVLTRGPNGALDVHPKYAKRERPAEVVLLYPAYPSSYLTQLRGLVSDFAQKRGIRLRPAQFVHWDETTVLDAVGQARGTMIIPYGPKIPERLLEPFCANKVVFLDGDFSDDGVPSIRLFSDKCIEQVFEKLRTLGHRRVDLLNTQHRNPEIDRRIGIWESWLERRGLSGQLWDDPAPVFTDPTVAAHRLMRRLLDDGESLGTAIMTTTCPGAVGAIRACWEREVRVGKDMSIATVNIEPPAEFFCPSIMGLNTPDLSEVLAKCFDWFVGRGAWQGSKRIEPRRSTLFEGESAAKPQRAARVTAKR
jgi:DNA-binding LacI/PurR family transcriptional regulator